ncbi:aldehyde dehydrogenase [Rhizobium sp. Root274]|uniref:xanthine dehydrogenase family protein molybdopterin-binding subunit n=1 Tax=unclassified Rhizobium TaxID=2613769 RepID=UPI0007140D83|nr:MULTISPECIES: molybdopterin cofactor-binding domain-containing protein [unclassified Rhizobium]KQW27995.1 aldehyde dehydrogenase [Rhizobium sp. Root1240]KRD28279.1 aldehyde dehydrogenase [Rhizobium sp. Root274]
MGKLGTLTRRGFLFGAVALTGGVAFGYYRYASPLPNPLQDGLADGEVTFNPYLKISPDNRITIITPRAEMGQGVQTTLATLLAEELDVSLDQVTTEHGPAAAAYFNAAAMTDGAPVPKFDEGAIAETLRGTIGVVAKLVAIQFTGGSSSMIDHFEKLRHAGAQARESVKLAAAARWNVKADTLRTESGRVVDPASDRSLTYGELAGDAIALAPSATPSLKPKADWKLLGKAQPRTDMMAKVTGAPIFGVDVDLPDMLYATVRMNPSPGGGVKRFDAEAVKAMVGVQDVIAIDSPYGHGVAVIADNTWRAFQAMGALEIEWETASIPATSAEMESLHTAALDGEQGFTLRTLGDPDLAFADADQASVIEAEYDVPFLSHAAMEPMNATALVTAEKVEIWAPNQGPTLIQTVAQRITGLPPEKIAVHTTFLGGGFGRRIEPDYADYALRVAAHVKGRPVKLTWTREEDMGHGPYRPMAKSRYRGLVDKDGMPKALVGSIASPSVVASALGRYYPDLPIGGPDNTLIDGAYNQPYDISNYRVDGRKVGLAVPVGFWRSVGFSYNTFMHESFIDELAHAGGKDPLQLRKTLLSKQPAALAVLEKVEALSNWNTPLPKGRARGVAFALSFGTWVAQVVEVEEHEGAIRVARVVCAADPGIVLDPRNFEAQMMSGIVYGLSAAIKQQISFADHVVEQSNYHDHDALRMVECPAIEIALLENSSFLGGAGEPGTPPVAPALANAIFALTGKRHRRLPLSTEITFA